MEAKIISEHFTVERTQIPVSKALQQKPSTQKPLQMSMDLQVQMYDNENRNLRNERYRLLEHVKQLEEANLDKERTLTQIMFSEEQSL